MECDYIFIKIPSFELSQQVLKRLEEMEFRWASNWLPSDIPTYWGTYTQNTVIRIRDKVIHFGNDSYYQEWKTFENYTWLTAEEFLDKFKTIDQMLTELDEKVHVLESKQQKE